MKTVYRNSTVTMHSIIFIMLIPVYIWIVRIYTNANAAECTALQSALTILVYFTVITIFYGLSLSCIDLSNSRISIKSMFYPKRSLMWSKVERVLVTPFEIQYTGYDTRNKYIVLTVPVVGFYEKEIDTIVSFSINNISDKLDFSFLDRHNYFQFLFPVIYKMKYCLKSKIVLLFIVLSRHILCALASICLMLAIAKAQYAAMLFDRFPELTPFVFALIFMIFFYLTMAVFKWKNRKRARTHGWEDLGWQVVRRE